MFNRVQLKRLIKIADMLRLNKYPNSKRIIEYLKKEQENDINELDTLVCSEITIKRDIKLLKEEFGCPLEYSRKENGYYLTDRNWEFFYPAVLNKTEMLAMYLGLHLAEKIFPNPLKWQIQEAVNYLLASNKKEIQNCSFENQLSLYSSYEDHTNPFVFMPIFSGWQENRMVKIFYKDREREISERIIEPHALVFYENMWYVKCFCHLRSQVRTFMLHRIESAELLDKKFIPAPKIYEAVEAGTFLDFKTIKDILISFHRSLHDKLYAMPLHKDQVIKFNNVDEYLTVELPECSEEVLIPWILAQKGEAIVIKPENLRMKIHEAAKRILMQNQD